MNKTVIWLMDYSHSYHLCPVCGKQSNTTSRVCSEHVSITYDQYGNVISYTDIEYNPELRFKEGI